jgi:hypothetical protein
MPKKQTIQRAKQLEKEGKSPSTQAGEFVREEIEEIREGKHGARSAKQAIAIGLSKARRAGVDLPPPKEEKYEEEVSEKAKQDLKKGREEPNAKPSPTRSRAITEALKREGTSAASTAALSRQAKSAARQRTAKERSQSAKKAAASRTPEDRSASAKKAAETRRRRST